MAEPSAVQAKRGAGSALEVLGAFLKLGCTSFGGPVAHLGYFRAEFVARQRWLDEAESADIVALRQFLRAGLAGALAAWLGFTLPSALALTLFGYGLAAFGDLNGAAWLHGLKIVAVAVVGQAVWQMAKSLAPDRPRASLAVAAAALVLAIPSTLGQVAAIALGAVVGWRLFAEAGAPPATALPLRLGREWSVSALTLFVALLVILPLAAATTGSHGLALVDSFYRCGALVFGGGHVILPLLQAAVVPPGWVGNDAFLAGYGAAQAVPGPLFTFAAYLGTVMGPEPHGWQGALLCLGAIFLPSFLLVTGALPFQSELRRQAGMQAALRGVNAAVVGLLLAALYQPVWISAILAPRDFILGLVGFLLLAFWPVPPWLVVILGALGAEAVARLA
jgi:chromate transporter